jgi:uncharacterized protein YbbC (DUF1343 family)
VARAVRAVFVVAPLLLGALLTFCAETPPPRAPGPPLVEDAGASSLGALDAPEAVVAEDAAPVDPFAGPAVEDPRFAAIAAAVDVALAEGKMPGCVVVVGRKDEILYKRAFGQRALEPARLPMQMDTVFDLASLTKPVATGASVMVLVDRGQVALDEPVAKYVPEFGHAGKGSITVRQLLLHTGGLVPDNPMSDFARGPDEAWRRIFDAPARWAPGERLVYSDVGFMVLGELVRRVSGKDVAAFAAEAVFAPLGLRETSFLPPEPLRARAAPTEVRPDAGFMQGEVHDPRAYALGGVAGHAGLFSTPRDMSRFAQAWLGKGGFEGARVVSPATFGAFVAPHDVPGAIRALGWDIASPLVKHRGEGLSRRAFGHGGYTGTSLWLDPDANLFVLFLSNRVHPNGKGAVHEIAGKIATIAAEAAGIPREPSPCERDGRDVLTGIDVLRAERFARVRGKKLGLVTNASGRAKDGTRTIDVLHAAPEVELARIFAPEHGLGADKEGLQADGKDGATGLPIVSLYGATFAPPPETLAGLDVLVFDVQDVGTRFYTYPSTLRRAMKAAADANLAFLVLDRPNPIDGIDVAGPVVDAASRSFVHHGPLPIRHGMTMGELALLFDAEDHMGGKLDVVRAQGWRRADYFDATGLTWVNPSPNLRNVTEALLYPAVALLEGTNLSVGRGTDTPFEVAGAPFVDGAALAAALGRRGLPGVSFAAASFTPTASPYKGERCGGVRLTITDRARFEPVRTGIALASELRALYAAKWHFDDVNRLLANRAALDAIAQGKTLPEIEATWEKELAAFRVKRDKYLLYPLTCPR